MFSFALTRDRSELLVGLNLVHELRESEWKGAGTLLLSTHLDRKEPTLYARTKASSTD